ncbi:putative cytochrome P450 [Terfezia claveryi]|nr:putative cytochrome P450 [Terfezia claveryi]
MTDPLHLSHFWSFFPWERSVLDVNNPSGVKLLVLPALISFVTGWALWRVVYNLNFHPLAKFPGPWLAATSTLWFVHDSLSGRSPFNLAEAHKKYGPIMRVAPNQLSVADAGAWKEIHGHHPREKTFIKGDFYNEDVKNFGLRNIFSTKDAVKHAEMRRMLAHAFSVKALTEQESIIQGYVDLLIKRLGERYAEKDRGPDGEYCNIVTWYNYTTFDIIGDLAFGESTAFACLKEQKAHPWVTIMLDSIYLNALNEAFRRILGTRKLGQWLTPKSLKENRRRMDVYARDLVANRLGSQTNRKDFWHYILNRPESKDASVNELCMQAQTLVMAGSETTSTTISSITFYLLKTPRVYNILKDEIRSTFKSYADITEQNTVRMRYLNAVIEEGLRLYPAAPGGMPRVSPGATVAGQYIPRGTDIAVHLFTASRDPAYWSMPNEMYPERWIDPKNTDNKEASQPFLLGPRGCLGKNLAYMEIRCILAKVIYAYNLELVDKDLDWEKKSMAWSLWWKPDLHVKVKKRPGLRWTTDEIPL